MYREVVCSLSRTLIQTSPLGQRSQVVYGDALASSRFFPGSPRSPRYVVSRFSMLDAHSLHNSLPAFFGIRGSSMCTALVCLGLAGSESWTMFEDVVN